MKFFKAFFIVFLFISFKAFAQSEVTNIGFEDGSFNKWQCYVGNIDSLGNINVVESSPFFDRQTIIDKKYFPNVDAYGNFPTLCPNGSKYSMKLGNNSAGARAERVTYTFVVPHVSSYSIIFDYAVVLNNPNHEPFEQPKFTAQVFDITDNQYINCPSFNFVASSDLPGFKLSKLKGPQNTPVYYKDWSTATIDLSNYAGKSIRIEFTTNDCAKIVHFGYAYLDVRENTYQPIAGNAYCAGQNSVTLFAPNGFASYDWYNADLSKHIGHGQSLKISPPPPDKTGYALKVFPYEGLGCIDTLYTVINKIDEGFKLNVANTVHGCPGDGVDLTIPDITAGSSPGMSLSYFTDSLGTSYLYSPEKVIASGTYYIQGINHEGCMNILPIKVIVAAPPLEVKDPDPVVFPTTVDLTKTFTHQSGISYSYYTNADATKEADNYAAVKYSGVYYIKAEDIYNCTTVTQVNVEIHPPPPYEINASNTFTPNGDGINDNFSVKVVGQATFNSVKIFNRQGQVVFAAKSPYEFWDGNYNGHKLPVGTYYWVFDGTDNYYNTRISKAASITLIR